MMQVLSSCDLQQYLRTLLLALLEQSGVDIEVQAPYEYMLKYQYIGPFLECDLLIFLKVWVLFTVAL